MITPISKTRSILLVDPDEVWQKILSPHLTLNGWDPHCASTAQEALSFLDRFRFQACLVESRLPDMPAVTLIFEIRNHVWHFNLPIIVLTAHADRKQAESYLGSAVSEYLSRAEASIPQILFTLHKHGLRQEVSI